MLVVENNVVFRDALNQILRLQFPLMEVLIAKNSDEAIRQVSKYFPQLVITDASCSGKDGYDSIQKIKSLYANITIIVLAKYNFIEYQQAAYQSGASHFFAKCESSIKQILSLVRTYYPAHLEPVSK